MPCADNAPTSARSRRLVNPPQPPFQLPDQWLTGSTAQGKGPSLWYQFEAQVRRLPPHDEAIWSRTGTYTWAETYAQACRYAQFMLQNGVKSGELMAMYMMNRPEFLFVHLGSWAIGSAPAWINYNLAGDALVHCLKVAGAKVLLVDEDGDCRKRIEDVRSRLEGELGMTIRILDSGLKGEISRMEPVRPGDEMRAPAKGKFPLFLFYTRYVGAKEVLR
jgi:acyl-coenzyme A synthetase/AMP-(fatty) acid ligase